MVLSSCSSGGAVEEAASEKPFLSSPVDCLAALLVKALVGSTDDRSVLVFTDSP